MNDIPLTIFQIIAGLIILGLAIYMFLQQTKKLGDEGLDPQAPYKHRDEVVEDDSEPYNPEAIYPITEPEIIKLEKYEKVYNHFEYEERGITFNDYVRKIECGTWHELA